MSSNISSRSRIAFPQACWSRSSGRRCWGTAAGRRRRLGDDQGGETLYELWLLSYAVRAAAAAWAGSPAEPTFAQLRLLRRAAASRSRYYTVRRFFR